MSYLCVPIFVTSVEQARRDIALAAESGADIVELRIDRLPLTIDSDSMNDDEAAERLAQDGLIEQLNQLIKSAPVPTIVTMRAAYEGGFSDASDETRRFIANAVADEF